MSDERDAAMALLDAAAVRQRANLLYDAALAGGLDHFSVLPERLPACADRVVETIRRNYPSLDIPFHARWRHFGVGGIDRWSALAASAPWLDEGAMARAAFDLAIVSVLLDGGAGPDWRYEEGRTGSTFTRSEGLAVASFDMFVSGAFSGRPEDPFRCDAATLAALTAEDLAAGFQVAPGKNPLVGLEGRTALLNRLGQTVEQAPEIFALADDPRPGGLFDHLSGEVNDDTLPADLVLKALLAHLGPIWPGRIVLGGVDLGDTWRHPAARAADATDGLVPFHKLSQWLAYSLVEPLEWAGIAVSDISDLTGLPEYRNGGLFLDLGVLALKDEADRARPHEVGSRLVVEWRALTVALLDRIAPLVRERLGAREEDMPLARILEGGTWAAGREVARDLRADGGPPLAVISDGTVF